MRRRSHGVWSLGARGGIAVAMGGVVGIGGGGALGFAIALAVATIVASAWVARAEELGWALLLQGLSALALAPIAFADRALGSSWGLALWPLTSGLFELAIGLRPTRAPLAGRLVLAAGTSSILCAVGLLAAGRDQAEWARIVVAGWGAVYGALLGFGAIHLRAQIESARGW